jgi:hypothetical protein
MVEFILVLPLFLTLLLGTVNAGLVMFALGAAGQSATVAMVQLANEANQPTANSDALTAMLATGIGTTNVAHLREIDIYELAVCEGGGPTPALTGASCSGEPDGTLVPAPPSDTSAYNRYCYQEAGCTPTNEWSPTTDNDNPAIGPLTKVGVTVQFTYVSFGWAFPTLNLQSTRYASIEPQWTVIGAGG